MYVYYIITAYDKDSYPHCSLARFQFSGLLHFIIEESVWYSRKSHWNHLKSENLVPGVFFAAHTHRILNELFNLHEHQLLIRKMELVVHGLPSTYGGWENQKWYMNRFLKDEVFSRCDGVRVTNGFVINLAKAEFGEGDSLLRFFIKEEAVLL